MIDTIVVCSGGFDPIHSGHLAIINEAYKFNMENILVKTTLSDLNITANK